MNPEIMSVGSDEAKQGTGALWLPAGSVRAVLAILAMAVTGLLLIMGKPVPEWWVASGSMIWAFYFKRA